MHFILTVGAVARSFFFLAVPNMAGPLFRSVVTFGITRLSCRNFLQEPEKVASARH